MTKAKSRKPIRRRAAPGAARKAKASARPKRKTPRRATHRAKPPATAKAIATQPRVESSMTLGPHHNEHLPGLDPFHVHEAPIKHPVEHQRVTVRHH